MKSNISVRSMCIHKGWWIVRSRWWERVVIIEGIWYLLWRIHNNNSLFVLMILRISFLIVKLLWKREILIFFRGMLNNRYKKNLMMMNERKVNFNVIVVSIIIIIIIIRILLWGCSLMNLVMFVLSLCIRISLRIMVEIKCRFLKVMEFKENKIMGIVCNWRELSRIKYRLYKKNRDLFEFIYVI